MSVSVKICGLNSREAAEGALRTGADFGGLVFFPKSPRHLSCDLARPLAEMMRGRLRIVALLVDPGDETVDEVVAKIAPDYIQLHGRESPVRTAAIAARSQRPIIKALALADASDLTGVTAYEDIVDLFLFDAKAPQDATRPGGLGAAFDRRLLKGARFKRPFGIAGGLNPDNVARALDITGASLADASSGVEDTPGRKSLDKIAAFVRAVRNVQYADSSSVEQGAA